MIIDGKEIRFFIPQKKVPERYYTFLEREVRLALGELKFVTLEKTKRSKSTDSLYFEVAIKGVEDEYTISLRSHPPIEKVKNYLYFYTPNYATASDLTYTIKCELTELFNRFAAIRGAKQMAMPERNPFTKKPEQKMSKYKKAKKLKGTKTHLLEVQEDSFDNFLKDFKLNKGLSEDSQSD